jgi:hypothetical protein
VDGAVNKIILTNYCVMDYDMNKDEFVKQIRKDIANGEYGEYEVH